MHIDVILPLSLNQTFTYKVPQELTQKVKIGMRIVVPFGKKRLYTAIVRFIHTQTPQYTDIKEIIGLMEDTPILRNPQLKFWDWIASYYQANIGDVYTAAIPSGLKLQSETQVEINENFNGELANEKEEKIVDALSDGKQKSISELLKVTEISNILPTLNSLMNKRAIEVKEELTVKYRPKVELYVKLKDDLANEESLKSIFDELKKSKRQLELLMKFIDYSNLFSKREKKSISKKELLEVTGISTNIFKSLVEKGVFEVYEQEVGRLNSDVISIREEFPLTDQQKTAFDEINASFIKHNITLLHGITSSGKTEIYIHFIKEMIRQKKQTLFLVPEIILTTQLTERLKKIFGNRLGVYHSKFSDAERVEIWDKVLHDKGYDVIIGVRSSIFLPFRNLGLIIIDEEHDSSYKQQNPAPRYHARNAAIVLASMHGAKTLLGSATPSVESFYNAKTGKYGFVALNERYQGIKLPKIEVVNTKEAYRKKEMEGHFTPELLKEIRQTLTNREQVILFQNRRGYAPYLECKQCGYVPKCKQCDVSLTVHKYLHRLTCHYCGYSEEIPEICPSCKESALTNRGFGTEKIEQEIQEFFPEARVARLDLDTTRSKRSFEKIIHNFENGKTDILVGTQMVSKGLDFNKVSLVGVLNADNLLNFPDFRSHERAFQLLEQVSGRSGRKNKQGKVIIQTSDPQHPVIEQVLTHNYKAMYNMQHQERQLFKYPPFFRLIKITIKHKDTSTLNQAANKMAHQLHKELGNRVLGPNIPLISRIQSYYIKEILIKVELDASVSFVKNLVQETMSSLQTEKPFKSVRFSVDIDPM